MLSPATSIPSTQVTIVTFDAHLTHDEPNPGPHHVIMFDGVTVNFGNSYNKHTGAFTCPVKGLYKFTYTIRVGYNGYGTF